MDRFLENLEEEEENIRQDLQQPAVMDLTAAEEEIFKKSTQCWICKQPFTADDVSVRDHDHVSGEFRGAAHQS